MNNLEQDLAAVVAAHASTITGKEFQETALRIAEAYFSHDDLHDYCVASELLDSLALELKKVFDSSDPIEM